MPDRFPGVFLVNGVISVKHLHCGMSGYFHDDRIVNPGLPHEDVKCVSQIVEGDSVFLISPIGNPCLFTGIPDSRPRVPNRLPVVQNHMVIIFGPSEGVSFSEKDLLKVFTDRHVSHLFVFGVPSFLDVDDLVDVLQSLIVKSLHCLMVHCCASMKKAVDPCRDLPPDGGYSCRLPMG